MDLFVMVSIVLAIFAIVSRVLRGDTKPPSDRRSPTGTMQEDSWPEPRRAAAERSTSHPAAPGRPRSPRPTESEKRSDNEIWETLSYSKSGESRRGPAGRESVVPTFRFAGLQDDATERAEIRKELREESWGDDEEHVEATARHSKIEDPALGETPKRGDLAPETVEEELAPDLIPASTPGTDPEAATSRESLSQSQSQPEVELEAGPEFTTTFGATGGTGLDAGTRPVAEGSSSSGYSCSSIGSVYTSTAVYTSSSVLGEEAAEPGQDSPEPAVTGDSSEADGESDDAGEGTWSARS